MLTQQAYAHTVAYMEGLQLIAVGEQVQAAIGEDAIDIEDDQPYELRTRHEFGRYRGLIPHLRAADHACAECRLRGLGNR